MIKLKKVDCALRPPYAKTVHKKLQQTHFLSILWGNADSSYPGEGLDPLKFGWEQINGYYAPEWFLGPSFPNELFQEREQEDDTIENIHINESNNIIEFDDNDSSSELSWSDDSESETEI